MRYQRFLYLVLVLSIDAVAITLMLSLQVPREITRLQFLGAVGRRSRVRAVEMIGIPESPIEDKMKPPPQRPTRMPILPRGTQNRANENGLEDMNLSKHSRFTNHRVIDDKVAP